MVSKSQQAAKQSPQRVAPTRAILQAVRRETPLVVALATTALFLLFGHGLLSEDHLANPIWFTFLLVWLFSVILYAAFAVVRHAEGLAVKLGEPLGTFVLTLAVTGLEVMMILAVMLTGHGSPTVARDAMFAVVMIVLNGMVGLSLLLGGLRYREQAYNLQGANAFLAVIIPLAVLALILPNYTETTPGPEFSPFQAAFLGVLSVGLYGVFLAIQNVRHRAYFMTPEAEPGDGAHAEHAGVRSGWYHGPLLLAYLAPVVVLAEELAVPVDYGIETLHAPAALGGFLVAVLVLSPESLAAVRAARANQLQRSVNILLGSVLASIGLTVPGVMAIGAITGKSIVLGLDPVNTVLLGLTLAVSMMTFASARTNVLLGAVHLLLFLAYVMLLFEH
jgi:Ca2+:H+ antiporter